MLFFTLEYPLTGLAHQQNCVSFEVVMGKINCVEDYHDN